MARDLNQCNFIGRLGQDVELKYAANGSAVANLSLACSDDYTAKDGTKVEQTNWIRIVIFGKLAEICGQYLGKGSKAYFSGKQITRTWDNKEGVKQYTTEIVAQEMIMLDSKGSGQEQRPQQQQMNDSDGPAPKDPGEDGLDDIPF
jgi:single-strand DNA-binding protein